MGFSFSRAYIFKFYLNANHFITINGKVGETHPHTWEFACEIALDTSEFVQFDQIEHAIDQYFDQYQNATLNEFEPFDEVNPTLENISEYFIEKIAAVVEEQGGHLLKMESSETPTRSYVLTVQPDDKFIEDEKHREKKELKNIADRIADEIIAGTVSTTDEVVAGTAGTTGE